MASGKQEDVSSTRQGNVTVHCLDTWSRLFAQQKSDQKTSMYLDVSHTHAVGDPQASACAKCAELFTVVPEVETSNQKRKSLMCFDPVILGDCLIIKGVLDAFFFHPCSRRHCFSKWRKIPICATLFRNLVSGRNAGGRANRFDAEVEIGESYTLAAPKLLAVAYSLPPGFLAPEGVWPQPLVMQRKRRRPSSQHSRPGNSAPITRSTSPTSRAWAMRECNARAHAPGNDKDSIAQSSVGTHSKRAGFVYMGRKPLPTRKPQTATTIRDFSFVMAGFESSKLAGVATSRSQLSWWPLVGRRSGTCEDAVDVRGKWFSTVPLNRRQPVEEA